jgi:hypothetical protein
VTSHFNCPPEILAKLSSGAHEDVKHNIARNPNTPLDILWRYGTHKSEYTRKCVRGNPKCPEALKDILDKYLEHPGCSELVKLTRKGESIEGVLELIETEILFEELAFN